ncbi:MAG: VanZ family protein [Clostridiaceae bacterium]|nr:VanZ family protein [Clostridiaceae bacterium]
MLIYFVIFVLPVIAVLSALLYLPFWAVRRKQLGKRSLLYHLVRYALLGCIFSLIYLTILWIFPIQFPPDHYFLNLRPFSWVHETYLMGMEKMLEQLFLNIAMFIPYGLLLPLAMLKLRHWYRTGLAVLGTTVSIEIVQYFIGRSADIDDVIMNLTGGLLGFALFTLLRRLFHKQNWWKAML